MTNKILKILLSMQLALMMPACTQDSPVTNPRQAEPAPAAERGTFAQGADVSWLTQMESEGMTFSNSNEMPTECMRLLRDECGVNAIRLRVWVNPAEGWNNADDVLVKARRAHSLGLRLMIDFHLSDTWADPAHQSIPAAWAALSPAQARDAVKEHVQRMLSLLKQYEIEPEWVQIGNETRLGMMWPLGNLDNGSNYAELTTAGYDAVKEIFPQAQVIVHLDSGDQLGLYTRVFDYMKAAGGKFDIIGMSLYPDAGNWQATVDACVNNINTLFQRYGVPVMVCEIGMDYDQPEACKQCIAALMSRGQATGHLQGIFYWEPQAPAGYNGGYNKGCFDNGKPTEALEAFTQ